MPEFIVEKCIERVDNHFKLALLASQRTHDLNTGASNPAQVVKSKGHKNVVVALYEIAEKKVCVHELFNLLIGRCKEYMKGNAGNTCNTSKGKLQELLNFSKDKLQGIQSSDTDVQSSNKEESL